MKPRFLQVALPVPMRRHYEYRLGEESQAGLVAPGIRVDVPFGRRKNQTGVILKVSNQSVLPVDKIKPINKLIDAAPLFSQAHLALLLWAAAYYQHPVGDALFSALPGLLRRGRPLPSTSAPAASGLDEAQTTEPGLRLNEQQQDAVAAITGAAGTYRAYALQGVTGSGKTEVYIEAVRHAVERGKQALILVPEIGLTPQFIGRLKQRLQVDVRVQHSALSETERLRNWTAARNGEAAVIIGARSAIWTPLKSPGLYIVDEEHDSSYKQESGFRYSAKDIAVARGKFDKTPVVLGSATPSLETLRNVNIGKYARLSLPLRAAGTPPEIRIVNLRNQPVAGAVSKPLLEAIRDTLKKNEQALLFLNRRGYAPVILCHDCGWHAECRRCSVKMTFHKANNKLICHHCDARRPLPEQCPDCAGEQLVEVGHGTQRLGQTLSEHFPEAKILRIDRDSARRRGSLEAMIKAIANGEANILIGTQMLAKGHHFPSLTLVGVIDADAGLLSADFRASERMAQLIVQVSGRAGRADQPGKVYIQTHFPTHPLLQTLTQRGYDAFARALLAERKDALLPPYAYLALLTAEAVDGAAARQFLAKARRRLEDIGVGMGLEILGPVAAPIEKRRGRFRSQLLAQSRNRNTLRKALASWSQSLESIPGANRARWALDIDPQDLL